MVLGTTVGDEHRGKWAGTTKGGAQSRASMHAAAPTTCAMAPVPATHGERVDSATAATSTRSAAEPTATAVQVSMTTNIGQASGTTLTLASPHMTMKDNDTPQELSHMKFFVCMGIRMRTRLSPLPAPP